MRRSTQNRKRDKQKDRSTVKEILPTKPEQGEEDLIAGPISRAQWADMVIQEDAEEVVGEIVDELLCQVMDSCYKFYLEKQLAPYAASWAKSYLTEIVECQILCLDPGDGPEEICTREDSEPIPAIPDCWAQGCVPTVHAASQSHCLSQQEVDTGKAPIQTTASVRQESNTVTLTDCGSKQDAISKTHSKEESDPLCHLSSNSPPAKTDTKKIPQVNKPPKNARSKLLPSVINSIEKKNVAVESKKKETVASKHKTVTVCCHKEPQPIPKLDPKCLPRHCIFPQYEIMDYHPAKPSPRKTGGLPRLEPNLNNQQSKGTDTLLKPPKTVSKETPERFRRRKDDDIHLPKQEKHQDKHFGPLRLDTMILAKGVSLSDSPAAESMRLKTSCPSQDTNLKPIRSDVAVPIYSIDQVASGPTPQVTPITPIKSCD